MNTWRPALVLLLVTAGASGARPSQDQAPAPRGVRMETLAWPAAAERLTGEAVVVLPVGGAAVQHGLTCRSARTHASPTFSSAASSGWTR